MGARTICEMLLKAGADRAIKGEQAKTAAQIALEYGFDKLARLIDDVDPNLWPVSSCHDGLCC